tara:strand:+ start:698 stop:850 length:153 start_codon:yes stop_codon:yes gene_type:complete
LTQNWSFLSGVYKGYPGTQKENLNSLSYKFDKGGGHILGFGVALSTPKRK